MPYQMTTEMEVEVDMAQPLSFDGHAEDEDLIDYDIDTTEQHQHPPYFSPLGENTYPEAQTDVLMDLHTKMGDQMSETDEHRAAEDGDYHDDMHLDEVVGADEDTEIKQISFDDSFAEGADIRDESRDDMAIPAEVTNLEAHDADNEIDYEEFEHEDDFAAGKMHEEHRSFEEANQLPEPQNNENHAENELAIFTGEPDPASAEQEAQEPTAEEAEEVEHGEISWEQENDHAEEPPAHGELLSQTRQDDADESAPEEDEDDDSEARSNREETQDDGSERLIHDEQNDDVDINHDKIEAVVELEEVSFENDQETLHDSSHEDLESFPQITVQYKGDEFPFFSLEASEGFFSDHLVLDYGMESLLAGFRAELSSEIAAGEELVFQVDELGLEFAESHLQDSLSSLTLRQILEIFDLLVKNQDPNSTRTLYTYLSTKPSTSKRYEFLVESAAAGKGLDEVIHLFQNPVPHTAAFVDLAQIADSVDDHIDSYKSSPADINGANEDLVEPGLRGTHQENEEDDEGETTWTENLPYGVEDHDDLEDDGPADEEELDDDVEEHVDEDEEKVEEAAEEATGEMAEVAEEVSAEAADDAADGVADELEAQASPAPVAASPFDDAGRQTMSQIFDEPAISADINDFSEHESNPLFIHDRVEDEPGDANDSEYEEELRLASQQSENEDNNPSVSNTGSTNTLADELDAASELAGIQADEILDVEAIEEVLIDNDALDEIDWRDDLDLVDATGSDILSNAPKRARPDDELAVEEGKDVKRRRS